MDGTQENLELLYAAAMGSQGIPGGDMSNMEIPQVDPAHAIPEDWIIDPNDPYIASLFAGSGLSFFPQNLALPQLPLDPNTPVQQTRSGRISRPPLQPPSVNPLYLYNQTTQPPWVNGTVGGPSTALGTSGNVPLQSSGLRWESTVARDQDWSNGEQGYVGTPLDEWVDDGNPKELNEQSHEVDGPAKKKARTQKDTSTTVIKKRTKKEDSPIIEEWVPKNGRPKKNVHVSKEVIAEERKERNRLAAKRSRERKKLDMTVEMQLQAKSIECQELEAKCAMLQTRCTRLEEEFARYVKTHRHQGQGPQRDNTYVNPASPTSLQSTRSQSSSASTTKPSKSNNSTPVNSPSPAQDGSYEPIEPTPLPAKSNPISASDQPIADRSLTFEYLNMDEMDDDDGEFVPPSSPIHEGDSETEEESDFEIEGEVSAKKPRRHKRNRMQSGNQSQSPADGETRNGDGYSPGEDTVGEEDEEDEDLFVPIRDVHVPVDEAQQRMMDELGFTSLDEMNGKLQKVFSRSNVGNMSQEDAALALRVADFCQKLMQSQGSR